MACPMSKQEILDFFWNKFLPYLNSGDAKMADEIFSQDYKTLVTGTDEEFASPFGIRPGIEGCDLNTVGHAGMVKLMNEEAKALDFKWIIQKVFVDGNTVAVRSEWSCLRPRHHELDKLKPPEWTADQRIRTRTFHCYTMRDGKIVSGEIMMDWMNTAATLAALPPADLRQEFESARGKLGTGECKPS